MAVRPFFMTKILQAHY